MLHVTNGMGTRLPAADIRGEVMFWFDVVHEGPTPAGLTLEQLSERRAAFIAQSGLENEASARRRFSTRDQRLREQRGDQEVVLWFEHDLYDQIQLLQILAWFARHRTSGPRLSLICIDHFPGVERFHGLGQLTPAQLATLLPGRQQVGAAQLDLALRGWDAYCAADPAQLVALAAEDCAPLPFLAAALRRHLQQYPSRKGGLSRTQASALQVVAAGEKRLDRVFEGTQELEEARFLGDTTFVALHLAPLCAVRSPLLRAEHGLTLPQRGEGAADWWRQGLTLTSQGQAVLDGQADHVVLNGIDRWLGGVHLRGSARWRWDEERRELCSTSDQG